MSYINYIRRNFKIVSKKKYTRKIIFYKCKKQKDKLNENNIISWLLHLKMVKQKWETPIFISYNYCEITL